MATNPLLSDWSELVPDVLSLVYKLLSIADFARARSVCSSWYSVSRSSLPRENHVPWLIFKKDRDWKLFDPEEGKFYITQISRLCFADCRSLATCGSWVLVTDEKAYLNIFNPFTLEIIPLPPLYRTSEYKILENYSFHFDYGFRKGKRHSEREVRVKKAVLWVDERTKDYFVVWTSTHRDHLSFCMKGDEEWIKTPSYEYLRLEISSGVEMAYKDKKLYILTYYGNIEILDFSQDFPREVPNHPYVDRHLRSDHYAKKKMKLTASGDVLMVERVWHYGEKAEFQVYKMNSTNEEWEIVDSLEEEEALVWDLSDTLPTKGVSGIKKNSIYFCDYYNSYTRKANTYEIPTQRIECIEQCSLLRDRDARWFLPCFGVRE